MQNFLAAKFEGRAKTYEPSTLVVLSIKHLALPSFCAILFMIQTFKVYQLVHKISILAEEVIYNEKEGRIVP